MNKQNYNNHLKKKKNNVWRQIADATDMGSHTAQQIIA